MGHSKLITLAVLFMVHFSGSTALAQSDRELINKCFTALAGQDGQVIGETVDAVKNLENIALLRDRMDAATCITQATGEPWQYYPDLNRLIPSSLVSSINDIKSAPEDAKKAFEAENSEVIAQSVYKACAQLYERDEVSALSNQTCINTFTVNGHPSLPPKHEYVRQYILNKFSSLTEDEVSVILELSPDSGLQ